jgi:hypothetical protein
MTNWAKTTKVNWWTFQVRRLISIPRFWWRFLNTHPFPEDLDNLDDLIAYGRRRPINGFNREIIRAYVASSLHKMYGCTSFVETGTQHGYTTAFARRAFRTPVFSSELNNTSYLVAKMYLAWARQTKLSHSNSSEFLKENCNKENLGNNPMFYLDAHWNEYMPLPDELLAIAEQCPKAVILIDDFEIPWEPKFKYDGYPDVRINVDTVRKFLGKRDGEYSMYLPSYGPEVDPGGKAIGYAAILLGQDKQPPLDQFPFNLIGLAPGTAEFRISD